MNETEFLALAGSLFSAIHKNTGLLHWTTDDGVHGAVETAVDLLNQHGIAWMIDAATGTGMSHIGFLSWLREGEAMTDGGGPWRSRCEGYDRRKLEQ